MAHATRLMASINSNTTKQILPALVSHLCLMIEDFNRNLETAHYVFTIILSMLEANNVVLFSKHNLSYATF